MYDAWAAVSRMVRASAVTDSVPVPSTMCMYFMYIMKGREGRYRYSREKLKSSEDLD